MPQQKMNKIERRSVLTVASIMALRMMGLFMVLPIFSLYASHLPGSTPLLVGLAMGIYGLTQALLQIPFGALSDRVGRKKIIAIGLVIFIAGSIVAALSETIWGMIIGRALQGVGAIGGTLIALIADLTREEQRTKAMAMSGMTIGLSFSLAMVLGPLFAAWIHVSGIFWLAALLSTICIILLFTLVPSPETVSWHPESEPDLHELPFILKNKDLMRLNIGAFILHTIFTASFVVIPITLHTLSNLQGNEQWLLYLPTLIIAFLLIIPCIIIAEKKRCIRKFFLAAIILLAIAEILFWFFIQNRLLSAVSLLIFFFAFSLLEAFLPSLVSRTVPHSRKGTALGMYSFSQYFGIFAGGTLGGWLYGVLSLTQVNLFCATLALFWLAIAFNMKNPQYSTHS